MKRILITGANGFIGQNLVNRMSQLKSFEIVKFTRDNDLSDLKSIVKNVDFVYHLAGEVKPKSKLREFETSNVDLTKHLTSQLSLFERKVPIVLASTIHADISETDYAVTKKKSENIIEEYSKLQKVRCFIFKLPHIFGENCKPNHNSVITTWIYNSINDININVFDRNKKMEYVYIRDVVSAFLHCLDKSGDGNCVSMHINQKYFTTLGQVEDFINEFRNYSFDCEEIPTGNKFKEILFQVYKSYRKTS